MEKSFFLYKSDLLHNNEAQRFLNESIKKEELTLSNRSIITLTDDDIEYLWSEFVEDSISLKILKLYLSQKRLPLIELQGVDAFNKCLAIKKDIRFRYAEHKFANCLHCPSSLGEFERSELLFYKGIKLKETNIKSINHQGIAAFTKMSELTSEEKDRCAYNIWSKVQKLKLTNMEILNQIKDKYSLFVVNDEKNHLAHVIACIYQYFTLMKLEDIYLITIIAENLGRALIASSECYQDMVAAKNYLQINNINSIIIVQNSLTKNNKKGEQ